MLNPTPNLNEQCLMVTEAMNVLAPGINQILFIREITPEDECTSSSSLGQVLNKTK